MLCRMCFIRRFKETEKNNKFQLCRCSPGRAERKTHFLGFPRFIRLLLLCMKSSRSFSSSLDRDHNTQPQPVLSTLPVFACVCCIYCMRLQRFSRNDLLADIYVYKRNPSSSCHFFFFNAEIEKEKLCSSEDVEGGGSGATSAGGGSGTGGVSASLTPAIWEKTIPYDGENFHLEYMDLDEFLLENGIPVTLEEEEQLQKSLPSVAGKGKSSPKVTASAGATANTTTGADAATTTTPPSTAAASVSASASSSSEPAASAEGSDPEETVTVTTLQPAKLGDDEEEEEEGQEEDSLLEASREELEVKEKQTGKRHYPEMPKHP